MSFFNSLTDSLLWQILSSGAVVNFFTVIVGTLIGLLFKKGIPEKVKEALMCGMALCVLYIGITGLFEKGANILIIIASFAIGSVLGELIDFDNLVNKLGLRIEKKFGKGNTKIADGFVASTLLFCVGAMTVVGSIDSGIIGDNSTLYSKAIIDGVSSIALTSTFGFGVILSAFSVLFIEGAITLLAVFVSPILTDVTVANMSIIGSLLIISLGTNMLGITKIKVMNYLPCIFFPLLFCFILK